MKCINKICGKNASACVIDFHITGLCEFASYEVLNSGVIDGPGLPGCDAESMG